MTKISCDSLETVDPLPFKSSNTTTQAEALSPAIAFWCW